MNSEEVYEIKRTWQITAADPAETGVAILLKLFEKYPASIQKFSAFKDMQLFELNDYARFKAHANRIIQVFDESVQSLGYDWADSKLEEMWTKLAVSHFKRKITKKEFNQIKEVILEVLTAACNLNVEQTEAWVKFINLLYSILFNALDKQQNLEI